MAKFQAALEIVEAFQLPKIGDDKVLPFLEWATENGLVHISGRDETLDFLEYSSKVKEPRVFREMKTANPGDWLVLDGSGYFTARSDEDFKRLYRPGESAYFREQRLIDEMKAVVRDAVADHFADQSGALYIEDMGTWVPEHPTLQNHSDPAQSLSQGLTTAINRKLIQWLAKEGKRNGTS